MGDNKFSFGKNLAQRRLSLKVSREELAATAGISLSMLSKIERDETNPTIFVASKIARGLNTTVSALLGERPDEQLTVGNIDKFIACLSGADEQLEKALSARKQLEPDFQANIGPSYIFDQDCRCLFASVSGAHAIGRSRSELVGRHWREFGLPAAVTEEIEANIRAVFASGLPLTAESSYSGSNGFDFFEYRLRPLFSDNGSIEAVIGTVKAITDKKLAELDRCNHYARLTHVVDACPLGIITIDKYGTINTFNKAAAAFLSPYSSANWVGKYVQDLVDWLGHDQERSPLLRALRGEEIENVQIHALGELWLTSASPLREATGAICGSLLFFQPIKD